MKNIFKTSIVLITFFCACSTGSENADLNSISTAQAYSEKYMQAPISQTQSISGTYKASGSDFKSTVTVSGSSWIGKLVIVTGFGDAYDNSNAIYSSGILNNGRLYDSSGYVQIGSVNGSSLSFNSGALAGVSHRK